MQNYETIVIGAGPAGLKCAEVLAEAGRDVLVLEKGKVIGDKVCAGGLPIWALQLGIPDNILQRKFNRIKVHTPMQELVVELDEPFLATVDRKDLGKWMSKNSKDAGAEVRTKSAVTKISEGKITVNDDSEFSYDYLVGADGSNSILRKHLGIPNKNVLAAFHYETPTRFKDLEVFWDPDKFGLAYVWIFPHKNSASVGAGMDISRPIFDTTVQKLRSNFEEWCTDKLDTKKAVFQAHTISYDYRGYEFGNKFLVGDAGGFASGATGEGIYQAIKSGGDVARRIISKDYKCQEIRRLTRRKLIENCTMRRMALSKTLTKLEVELTMALGRSKWLNRKVLSLTKSL